MQNGAKRGRNGAERGGNGAKRGRNTPTVPTPTPAAALPANTVLQKPPFWVFFGVFLADGGCSRRRKEVLLTLVLVGALGHGGGRLRVVLVVALLLGQVRVRVVVAQARPVLVALAANCAKTAENGRFHPKKQRFPQPHGSGNHPRLNALLVCSGCLSTGVVLGVKRAGLVKGRPVALKHAGKMVGKGVSRPKISS